MWKSIVTVDCSFLWVFTTFYFSLPYREQIFRVKEWIAAGWGLLGDEADRMWEDSGPGNANCNDIMLTNRQGHCIRNVEIWRHKSPYCSFLNQWIRGKILLMTQSIIIYLTVSIGKSVISEFSMTLELTRRSTCDPVLWITTVAGFESHRVIDFSHFQLLVHMGLFIMIRIAVVTIAIGMPR